MNEIGIEKYIYIARRISRDELVSLVETIRFNVSSYINRLNECTNWVKYKNSL